jgi:hypothetical protein
MNITEMEYNGSSVDGK